MGLVGKQGPQKHSKIKEHTIIEQSPHTFLLNALSNEEKQTVNCQKMQGIK